MGIYNSEKDIFKRIKYIASFRKPKILWSIIGAAAIVLITGGCLTNPKNEIQSEPGKINYKKVFDNKTSYVGDASKVSNLANQLYYAEYKEGIELQTSEQPYSIRINYDENTKGIEYGGDIHLTDKMLENAAILFALIDNVDEIQLQFHKSLYSFRRSFMEETFQEDIRNYASSYERFRNELIPMLTNERWELKDDVYMTDEVELYVWNNEEVTGTHDIYYTLLPGTNEKKESSMVYDLDQATNHLDLINEELSRSSASHLTIRGDASLSKEEMLVIDDSIIFNGESRSIGGFGEEYLTE